MNALNRVGKFVLGCVAVCLGAYSACSEETSVAKTPKVNPDHRSTDESHDKSRLPLADPAQFPDRSRNPSGKNDKLEKNKAGSSGTSAGSIGH